MILCNKGLVSLRVVALKTPASHVSPKTILVPYFKTKSLSIFPYYSTVRGGGLDS